MNRPDNPYKDEVKEPNIPFTYLPDIRTMMHRAFELGVDKTIELNEDGDD